MKSLSEWYIVIDNKDYDIDIIQYFADYALVQVLNTKEIMIIDYLYIHSRSYSQSDLDNESKSNIISLDWWRKWRRYKRYKKNNNYK